MRHAFLSKRGGDFAASVGFRRSRGYGSSASRRAPCSKRGKLASLSRMAGCDKLTDSFRMPRREPTACRVADAIALASLTLNEYLNAASAFCNWMVRQARIVGNPLKYVAKANVKGNETVRRRALTDDETRRILDVAGPRKIVYLTALCTGLRRHEMEALEWGDLDLDTAASVIKVRAATTKNKRAAVLPVHAKLAEEL